MAKRGAFHADTSQFVIWPAGQRVVWVGFDVHDGLVSRDQRHQLIINILEWFKP